jgi:carbonic anhydrase/acetyltransferase-like protein (isoleucine patch superfamily)
MKPFQQFIWKGMNNNKMIIAFEKKNPKVSEKAFIAENASVIGNVEIGEHSSVWFGAVLRGDSATIIIGKNSNIQG